MPVYTLGARQPDIHPDAYVSPDAVVIGDVVIGAEASVWPGAVLRAGCRIEIGPRTSIQDGTVLHATAEWPTVIGAECVVGTQALVSEDTQIPPGSLALGVPARLRPVAPAVQASWIDFAEYVPNARTYRDQLWLIEPHQPEGAR